MEAVVKESGQGKFGQVVVLGQHTLIADEPFQDGGNDAGPSPYEFLLAALGSCTSMTLRMYADLKQIPLEQVVVKLKHQKIHAKDCASCDNNSMAMVDHIDRIIELRGNLTLEQRKKLLEIANKCPVHKTLTAKISITTMLQKNDNQKNI